MIQDPSYLPNMLNRVVQLACECLKDTPNGVPGFCGLYHTSSPADCCDSLTVWLERLTTIKTFPSPWSGPLRCSTMIPMASVAIQLTRPCWPVLKIDPQNPFPGNEETSIAAANLEMDAIALYCCLMSDLSNDDGFIKQGACLAANLGTMTPGRPQGGCASWTVRFQIELDPCCPPLP